MPISESLQRAYHLVCVQFPQETTMLVSMSQHLLFQRPYNKVIRSQYRIAELHLATQQLPYPSGKLPRHLTAEFRPSPLTPPFVYTPNGYKVREFR